MRSRDYLVTDHIIAGSSLGPVRNITNILLTIQPNVQSAAAGRRLTTQILKTHPGSHLLYCGVSIHAQDKKRSYPAILTLQSHRVTTVGWWHGLTTRRIFKERNIG